ncbi:MAG: methyltransferase domain-containing protein [Gemmatimonadaceae bacterium]
MRDGHRSGQRFNHASDARALCGGASFEVREASVFDLSPTEYGTFDVVYSWGVLHHAGAMERAIAAAERLVAPNGILCLALYAKTFLCPFWRFEKRAYTFSPRLRQRLIRTLYVALYRSRFMFTGQDFGAHVANYRNTRGMDFYHDVHDWLGGYPYESITPDEAHEMMRRHGYDVEREFVGSVVHRAVRIRLPRVRVSTPSTGAAG